MRRRGSWWKVETETNHTAMQAGFATGAALSCGPRPRFYPSWSQSIRFDPGPPHSLPCTSTGRNNCQHRQSVSPVTTTRKTCLTPYPVGTSSGVGREACPGGFYSMHLGRMMMAILGGQMKGFRKPPAPPKQKRVRKPPPLLNWRCDLVPGDIPAVTKSEARAMVKAVTGKPIPPGTVFKRVAA